MCFLSFQKTIHSLLDSAQHGKIFPFLYCLADRIRQDTGCNTNDPHIFPAEKKSDQIDGGDDCCPVYEVESHCRMKWNLTVVLFSSPTTSNPFDECGAFSINSAAPAAPVQERKSALHTSAAFP